jgi:hypothetical protein
VARSGGGGATWRSRERPALGREGGGRVAGGHVARLRAARGQLELGKTAGERRGPHGRKAERGGGDWRLKIGT